MTRIIVHLTTEEHDVLLSLLKDASCSTTNINHETILSLHDKIIAGKDY